MTRRSDTKQHRKRRAKFRRAKVHKFLFTVGPHRLTGGRLTRRHLAQGVMVRELEVSSPLWPAAFDGLRIGHVSDFHLGDLMPLERALEVVYRLAEEAPDIVACTGDVVDLHHDAAGPLLDAIAAIDAPLGSALVLGNHDELHCPDTLADMAESAGLLMLRNEALQINRGGDRLIVAGIDWHRSAVGLARFVDTACGDETHLLLAHNPKAFLAAADVGIPLTLSGHTHGGQVAMPSRPGANLAATTRYTAGLYESGPSRLYVTPGVGAWFPLRVNCPAEIAMITVRSVETSKRQNVESP